MQDIYNCVPETAHVSSVYSVAAVLCLQFLLHLISHFYKLYEQNVHCCGLICNNYITVRGIKKCKIRYFARSLYLELLHQHFPHYACSAQCGCFL